MMMMMMQRVLVLLSSALATAATANPAVHNVDLSANSAVGSKLLSKAKRVLNNNDDDYSFAWATDYSIKFQGCHNTVEFRPDDRDGSDTDPMEVIPLVHFKLCRSSTCSGGCSNGGEYVVEMRDFVEAYVESKMTAKEYNCEVAKDNCYCEDVDDDEACEYQCYTSAGLDYCIETDDDGEEFDVQDYLECKDMEIGDDDSANQLFVGAYCSSNGKAIYLGEFTNEACSKPAKKGTYQAYSGVALPYTSESLVSHDCISCQEPQNYDDDKNGDNQDQDAVLEICEKLYERSAKCEKKLKIDYPSTGGCDYIHSVLPQLERVANRRASAATVFAWLFFATTIGAVAFAFYLYKKQDKSQRVSLLSSEGGEMT